jgi:subtilisin family serine protease
MMMLLAGCLASAGDAVAANAPSAPAMHSAETPENAAVVAAWGERTAVVYDVALSGSEMLARCHKDMLAAGLTIARTMSAANAVLVEGDEATVRAALARVEGLPKTTLSPVYLVNGDRHPDSLIVFTNRLSIQFKPTATEAAKVAFLQQNGLERVYETASGHVLVRTSHRGDLAMAGVALDLRASAIVERADVDIAVGVQPTAVGAPQEISDPFFSVQWHLFNDGLNTNNGFGRADADMDAPRAWQINQTNGNESIGASNVSVAVFDSGIELNHPDLAESLDPQVGRDFIDGGTPEASRNTLGAHGTAMAGLVAAQLNTVGVVGVAPGLKLYISRVFGPDYTVSTANLASALSDTISRGVDVNLHPYAMLPGSCLNDLVNGAIETAFRQTFESGRAGIGITNIAASGNVFAQLDYPASSFYCLAVGSSSAEDNRIEQANWTGLGVDFVMPSYRALSSQYVDETFGTGIVTTDLSGSTGFVTGSYGSLGQNNFTASSQGSVAAAFLGTSVSAALAAGTVGLMLGDERYACLAPHALVNAETRDGRRARGEASGAKLATTGKGAPDPALCAVRIEGDTIFSSLLAFADLPSPSRSSVEEVPPTQSGPIPTGALDLRGPMEYLDQFNAYFGGGRPNPARALAAPSGIPTGDTVLSSFLIGYPDSPVYGYSAAIGAADSELDPELRGPLTGGWRAVGDNNGNGFSDPETEEEPAEFIQQGLVVSLTNPAIPNIIVSPHLTPIRTYSAETSDGTIRTQRAEDGVFYAWTDSREVIDTADAQNAQGSGLLHNPTGSYLAAKPIRLLGPSVIPTTTTLVGVPNYVEIDLGHELGVENGNSTTGAILTEVDPLDLEVVFRVDNGERVTTRRNLIATITGDSAAQPKRRVCAAGLVDTSGGLRRSEADMIVRTYRFLMPAIPEGTVDFRFELALNLDASNSSFIPTYVAQGTTPPITFVLAPNVKRDYRGFIFTGLRMFNVDPAIIDHLTTPDHLLKAEGTRANFTINDNEVLFASPDSEGVISVAPDRAGHLAGSDLSVLEEYEPAMLARLGSRITGLKSHPLRDILAVTTEDGVVRTITSDGVAPRVLATGMTGVRDVAWDVAGGQLIVARPDQINVLVIQPDGSVNVETPIRTGPTSLENFRTPVFDAEAGAIFFTAEQVGGDIRRIYLATRAGRIINFSGESHSGLLAGWNNVNQYDIDISRSGRRLSFVANAGAAPTFDEDGNLINSIFPSASRARVFVIENIHWVSQYRNVPIYTILPFSQLTTLPSPDTSAARYPRFTVQDVATKQPRIAFTYQEQRGSADDESATGRLAIMELDFENLDGPLDPPAPTPAPTSTPVTTATPTPVDTAQVVKVGEVNFENTDEGWSFASATPAIVATDRNHRRGNPSAGVDGALQLTSQNTNSFGFWVSPIPLFSVQRDSLYVVRAWLRANGAEDALVPTTRLRVNSVSLEESSGAEVNSSGDLSFSPQNGATRAVDLMLRPSDDMFTDVIARRGFSAAVDLVNFAPGDSAVATLSVEQVDLYRLDDAPTNSVVKDRNPIYENLLDTVEERSVAASASPSGFTAGEFTSTETGLGIRFPNGASTGVGFWTFDGTDIPVSDSLPADGSPLVYKATFVISCQETDVQRIPSIRVRIADNQFQKTAMTSLTPALNSVAMPKAGKTVEMVAYLVLNRRPAELQHLVAAFDLINTNPNPTSQPVVLESLRIESISIPNYPDM